MKKYIVSFFAVFVTALIFTACSEDEGTEPGSNSNPVITIYQYAAVRPNNPDNDVVLRLSANSKTAEGYYLKETIEVANQHIGSMGKDGYMNYVVENGIKVDGLSGESVVDVTLTDLYGEFTITVVAVSGNKKTSTEATFKGLDWNDVATGTYNFGASSKLIEALGLTSAPTTLQICTTDETLYRFKDVFGAGYSLKIQLIDYKGSDDNGKYQFFRIPQQETPYLFGDFGAVGIRDIGYWQGDESFIISGGFESGMYADYNCFVYAQYFVSAGDLGYGYDSFVPDRSLKKNSFLEHIEIIFYL